MKKRVLFDNDYGFTYRIDVPDTADFRVGDFVEYDYEHVKIVEVIHDLDDMITYYICE